MSMDEGASGAKAAAAAADEPAAPAAAAASSSGSGSADAASNKPAKKMFEGERVRASEVSVREYVAAGREGE